jgi:putative flippase GtrA
MKPQAGAAGNFSRRSAITFLMVGGAATGLHYAVMFVCAAALGIAVVWSSVIGFAVGAVANYLLNARLTFRSDRPHRSAAPRFLATAGAGLLLNYVLLSFLVSNGLHAIAAQLLTTLGVLIWNYCINGLWTFANRAA